MENKSNIFNGLTRSNYKLYNGETLAHRLVAATTKIIKGVEREDIIAFDAKVESADIEFFNIEGEDDINEEVDGEPIKYLPKDYKGTIIVEFYETEFNPIERISKNNFTKVYDRRSFNKKYKNFYCKREANGKSLGYYKEPQAMYYQGKSIKNLSNIEKF